MALPLIVSPYLRPFLRDGELVFDNGITGAVESPTPTARAVIRAMWQAETAPAALETLVDRHGADPVANAIAELYERAMLFESLDAASAALDAALETRRPRVPFVDQIELTNRCPMRCGFCPRGIPGAMARPIGRMSPDLFQRLLDQLHPEQADYRPLELHHLGESLLHPELPDLIAAASARGLPTELSVNPSLLAPELGRALVAAGLRRLVVSLDGMDGETLGAVRGPAADYADAERNLDALIDHLGQLADPPALVIQMIDLARNRDQHQRFLARWGATGVKTVRAYVKPLDGVDPDTGQPSPAPLGFLCSYPWRSVVVLWDGRVVPCCRDADAALVLGDLSHQSLEEIWNGPAAERLRRHHRERDFDDHPLCRDCPWRRDRFAAAIAGRHPDRAVANPLQW